MPIEPPSPSGKTPEPPWYRQFWPWFIIALPASAVIASLISLYLAITRPDYMVVEDEELQRLNSGLKAQSVQPVKDQLPAGKPDSGKPEPGNSDPGQD